VDADDDGEVSDDDDAPPLDPAAASDAAKQQQAVAGKTVRMFAAMEDPAPPPPASGAYGFGDLDQLSKPQGVARARGPGLWAVMRQRGRALYRRVVMRDEFKINSRR
jgi:hypothetical protein